MDSPPSRHGSSPPPSGAVGPRIFAFDGFEFDEERWELRDQGALVDVQPKVMQTIALLLRNRERVVSTEELVDALWPSVTVTEASLTKAIRIARQVLRDDGEAQRLIRTTRGRGYRFVGTVEERSANARLHAAPPLPVPGAGTDEPFVGRDLELGKLLVALERARGGRSSFILVGGDPGVGKTSLVEAFAARAERTAVRVIWGRAWEEGGAPDLWPWIQILRGLLASGGALGPDDLGEVSRVLTMVLAGEQDGAPPRTGAERFRAFDAIVSVLSRAGRKAPLVLVLEDLHSADASTLTLTRFLVREIRDAGVFVLGTYRPSDLSVDPRVREPFKKLLSEARVVPLSGLGEDDTRRLMQAALGVPPDSRLFDRVRRVTEGNPLFIVEVTRRLAARTDGPARVDAEIGIPERIVEAVRARFDPLPKETRELLSAAAVIGRQFELPVLRRIVDTAEDPALLLEPAIVRGIIAEIPESLGTWAFSHMLLRDVLYDAFGIAQRAALHQRVGEVLETSGAPGVELPAARLAHHFLRAALGAGSEKAARYSAAAGRQALRSFAFEDAVRHFEHALEALHYASECEGQSMDLLLALAKAERLSGQYAQSRVTLDRALSLARAARDPIRVARVALDYGEVRPESGAPNPELLALLEEAAALLVDGTDASTAELRTLVDARLATCLAFAGRRDEAESRSARALESARSLGKPSLLGHALHCRHWVLWRPGTARERLTMATEMVALDGTSGEALPSMDGRLCEVTDLLELGEAGDFVRALARYERAAAALRDPSCLYNVCVFRTMRALLEGRFVDAERLAREAAMSGRRIHPENAQNFFSAHLWWTCIEQGRPMDLVSAFRERLARDRDNTLYRIALLRLLVEASDLGAAREELDIVARTDFARFPSDWALLPSLAHLATACFRLGDAPRARELRALLAPFVDSHVVLGPAIVYLGPASYYAALLSAVLGAYDDAESELEHALHAARRLGARPVVARVQLALGEILLRRGGADVPARAVVSGEAALSLSTELGMASVERRARALLEGLGVESAPRGS